MRPGPVAREITRFYLLSCLLLLALIAAPGTSVADEFLPATLEVNERDNEWVDITWKVPLVQDAPVAATPVSPSFVADAHETNPPFEPSTESSTAPGPSGCFSR